MSAMWLFFPHKPGQEKMLFSGSAFCGCGEGSLSSPPVPKEAAVIRLRLLHLLTRTVPRTPSQDAWVTHFEGWSRNGGQGVAWRNLQPVRISLHRISSVPWWDSGMISSENTAACLRVHCWFKGSCSSGPLVWTWKSCYCGLISPVLFFTGNILRYQLRLYSGLSSEWGAFLHWLWDFTWGQQENESSDNMR